MEGYDISRRPELVMYGIKSGTRPELTNAVSTLVVLCAAVLSEPVRKNVAATGLSRPVAEVKVSRDHPM